MIGFAHQTVQIQTPKSSKVDIEISIIPTSVESSFLQPLPHQMLAFDAPDVLIHLPKPSEK